MKAIIYRRFGSPDVLSLEEVEKPTPADDEVLIKVRASSVNPVDWHLMRGTPYIGRPMMGWRKPRSPRLGVDVAGEVEAVGRNVTEIKAGDEVFGSCRGAFAEYTCTRASNVIVKPGSLSFEQAGCVDVAAMTALQGMRDKGGLQPGQSVLINGAAGGVGTFAVQIAKALGASATGVCSTRNVEKVRSLGADRVIDYTQEDFTRDAGRYDVLLDCVGNHSLSACRRTLRPKGVYVLVGGPAGRWIDPFPRAIQAVIWSKLIRQKMAMMLAKSNNEDLALVRDFMTGGKVTPVIDRTYPLDKVPQAIGYLEQGHARGKVVITVS